MNLYRIGKTVINVDRINFILDHQVLADSGAPEGRTVVRVVFDQTHIDLTDHEAEGLRYWFRRAARRLDPHTDENGEELVSPDDQVRKACAALYDLIDSQRPGDRVMRHAAHRLRHIIDQFLTGELEPVCVTNFERDLVAH